MDIDPQSLGARPLCIPSGAGRSLRSLGYAPAARGAVAPSGPGGPVPLPSSASPGPAVITDYWPHPLTAEGRETRPAVVPPGTTLADLVADADSLGALPLRCLRADMPALKQRRAEGARIDNCAGIMVHVDGRPVPRAAWAGTRLAGGEIVTLRAVAADGGDKNPFRILLQLAVIVASIYVPPLITANLFGQAAIGAAISIVGGLIVNALAPVPAPDGAQAGRADALYTLTGGANRARPYEPLLLVLGEHRVFPDLGAAEYTEIADDDHYLHQIFNFGLGDLDVGALTLGETPLDAYEEVQTEFGDAQGRIALVAGNVDTAAGAALEDTAFVERTTGAATRRIGIDIAGRLFRVNERDGSVLGHSVDIEIEWEAEGVALRRRTLTLRHASQAPLRRTVAYDLGSARDWTVRVRRTGAPSDNERNRNKFVGTTGTATTVAANSSYGVRNAGGGQAHNNMPPYCVVNFIIKW